MLKTSKRSYLAVMKSSSNCHKEYNTHTLSWDLNDPCP